MERLIKKLHRTGIYKELKSPRLIVITEMFESHPGHFDDSGIRNLGITAPAGVTFTLRGMTLSA